MQPGSESLPNRRQFLTETVAGGALFGGAMGFLSKLPAVSADEAKLPPALVRDGVGVDATVRLLEETPRDRLLEEVGARVRGGLSYQELLAALMLAAVRNVQPRPSVGFKFHAVLVINSAHLASLASADSDRWLPIFWSLDRFKSAQAETKQASGWQMGAVDEARVPPARKAREAFVSAMDRWDEEGADVAAAALARTAGRNECFELFARYGARDWRDIGHKAIYVANSFRTLECIGWQHAEPVLRSLAYALLRHEAGNPADDDRPADRPWRRNIDLAPKIAAGWEQGKNDPSAAGDLLDAFRTASDAEAASAVADALKAGVSPKAAWDAVFAASGEQLMRRRGILTLHAVTTANALRYAYEASGDDTTRLMMLLQAASFMPLFRDAARVGNGAGEVRVDRFEPAEADGGNAKGDEKETGNAAAAGGAGDDAALEAVFADAGRDHLAAARKALAYLDGTGRADRLMHAARRLVFLKGDNAHDYKFSSAVLEDYAHLSPAWRNRFLAAGMFYFPGSGQKENSLVKRTRAALEGA